MACGIMKYDLCSYEFPCLANVIMCCGDVSGLLFVWYITFCGFILCFGKVFQSHSNFFVLFDFDNVITRYNAWPDEECGCSA